MMFGAVLAQAPAAPLPAADPRIAALDEKAPLWLAEHHVPSIAVAYIRDGRVAWTRVYGEQSQGVPATDVPLLAGADVPKLSLPGRALAVLSHYALGS